MYNTLQFLHVAAAIVWLGSGVGIMVFLAVLRRSGDPALLGGVIRKMDALGNRLFAPAAMATLVFGILAVIVGDWSFGDAWIVIGLVGVALSMVAVALESPATKRLMAAIDERPDHPDAAAAMKTVVRLNMIELTLLFVVVWAMVVKPGT